MTHAYSAPLPTSPETVWPGLRAGAETLEKTEPALSSLVRRSILAEKNFQDALGSMLSGKLASPDVDAATLRKIFTTAHQAQPALVNAALLDLLAIMKNDPAAHDLLTPFLFFKGFHALQSHRAGHWLWRQGRKHLALHLQNRVSDLFGVDIHPAAPIGHGVMMDHATGIVIGETAAVGDDVLFWHGVTLGGKGSPLLANGGGDRHPKIRNGVQLGAGCTLLGAIEIGANARVAAGSVVLDHVAAGVTVAGIPAKVIRL